MVSFGNIQFLRLTFLLLFLTILGRNLFSADRYWDTDGNNALNAGWNSTNWNTKSDGSGTKSGWTNQDTAIFSAGTDATGSSTITADLNSMTLGGLTVEEGVITIASGSGSLTLSGNADFNVAEGSTLTITEPLLYGGNTLNKTGKGLLTIGAGVDGTTTIEQGKIDIANGVNLSSSGIFTGTSGAGSSNKSIIGGLGIVKSITIGDNDDEIDFIAPGLGYSSSLTSASSQKQVAAERSTGAVGTFTTDILNWNSGGVYDWEVKTFTPSTTDGAYDVLAFDTINFEISQTYNINIMSVSNDAGTAGAVTNREQTFTSFTGTGGFKFLSGSTVSNIGSGDVSDRFNIRSDDFYYHNNNWMGDWGVWRDGGDFYLTYSAVPEPSTYIMISALFLIIGFNQSSRKTLHSMIASLRQKFSKNTNQPVPAELS